MTILAPDEIIPYSYVGIGETSKNPEVPINTGLFVDFGPPPENGGGVGGAVQLPASGVMTDNTPKTTNTGGSLTSGGMTSGSSTSTANFDFYALLNALGFTKSNPVQTGGVVQATSAPAPIQQASILPANINMNTVLIAGVVVLIIYLITR